MKRLNITIDEETYEKARAFAFVKKMSFSKLIREALKQVLKNNEAFEIKLTKEEEEMFLNIIKNDKFLSSEEVKRKLDL